MTREKAIFIQRTMKENLHKIGKDFPYRDEIIPLMKESCDMSIKALEQEPKIGKWKYTKHYGQRYRVCTECKCERKDDLSTGWNYCPNCGCRMKGEVEK